MEASALTTASRRGLLARRSPLLRLQGDERLVALVRSGNPGAFEAIVDRYTGRLIGFCRQMLGSTEDAEDVLQEVFVNAYRAMLADNREINLRPWLYRIARNRCLNHLRKPKADAQESMESVPAVEAATTHERVHNREEFRQLLADVKKLPETQRSALLLREMDAMSYEDIAVAMDTTVPSIKSLLVRARISLAEASQARLLTCGEVRLELAEAAEGLRKVSGSVRRHVRDCDECAGFRKQLRGDAKVLAGLSPIGPLLALKGILGSKLGIGSGAGAGAAGATATAGGTAGALSAGGAALGAGGAATGLGGAVGGVIGAKAVAGVVTAAVITAGAVQVEERVLSDSAAVPTPAVAPALEPGGNAGHVEAGQAILPAVPAEASSSSALPAEPPVKPTPEPAPPVPAEPEPVAEEPVTEPPAEVLAPEVEPAPEPVPEEVVATDSTASPTSPGDAGATHEPAAPAGGSDPGGAPTTAPAAPAEPAPTRPPAAYSPAVQQNSGISSNGS